MNMLGATKYTVNTGIGAGEKQAQKVVSGEASWCGEDK
jgi:hypothetical protein